MAPQTTFLPVPEMSANAVMEKKLSKYIMSMRRRTGTDIKLLSVYQTKSGNYKAAIANEYQRWTIRYSQNRWKKSDHHG